MPRTKRSATRATSMGPRLLAVLASAACGPSAGESASTATSWQDETTSAQPSSEGGTTTHGESGSTSAATTPTGVDSAATTAADESGEPSNFLTHSDFGGAIYDCDVWIDDCPPGMKCMPWGDGGKSTWNATRCTPLADDPQDIGEPCHVVDSATSGIDDCVVRAMCWDVDPETLEGTCVGFCSGDTTEPTCTSACDSCQIWNNGVLILCLPICDPLLQDCPEGRVCGVQYEGFECLPNVGELGYIGDGCEYPWDCEPELFCADAALIPGCASEFGCCTPFCDVNNPQDCAALAGTACVPWFDDGEAPPCFSAVVGVCLLPE